MKGNNGKGNTIERDDWETPKDFFNKLKKQYFFRLDCCATKENSKCEYWENDFLNRNLNNDKNICWINPPFSMAYKMIEHFFKIIKKGIGIYRCDNFESKIWQNLIFKRADWVFVLKGRIAYEHNQRKQTSPRFGSALFGIGVEPPKNLNGVLIKCGLQ